MRFAVGHLVQYHDDGLRAGHILALSEGHAKVRPIGPKNVLLRPVCLALEDLIPVAPKEGSKLNRFNIAEEPIER